MTVGEPAETFERCMSVGGIAVFPADTVYGLACDAGNAGDVIRRLYALKRRPLSKPSAVMFFDLDDGSDGAAGARGADSGGARAAAAGQASRCCMPNPERRFPLACGDDPTTLGLRVRDRAGVGRRPLAGAAVKREPRRRRRGAHAGRGARAAARRGRHGDRRRRAARARRRPWSTCVATSRTARWSIVRRRGGVRARASTRRCTTSSTSTPASYDADDRRPRSRSTTSSRSSSQLASGAGAATDPGPRHRHGGDRAAAAGPPSRRDARRSRRVRRDAGGGALRGCPPTASSLVVSRLEQPAARRAIRPGGERACGPPPGAGREASSVRADPRGACRRAGGSCSRT